MPLQCYFECVDDGKLYKFPKNEERFNVWRNVLHPLAQEYSKEYIYQHFRLCYRHFKDCYRLPSQRLTMNAIPTIKLIQYGGQTKVITNICIEDINKFEEAGSVSETDIEDQKVDINNFKPLITKDVVEVSDDKDITMYAVDVNKFKDHESITETVSLNEGQRTNTKDRNHFTTLHVRNKRKNWKRFDRHCYNLKVILENTNANIIQSYSRIGYSCLFCSVSCKYPADLKEHSLDKHSSVSLTELKKKCEKRTSSKLDITGLRCNLCNNDIDCFSSLIYHLKEIHGIQVVLVDSMNRILPLKFGGSLLHCGICSKVFKKFRTLLSHVTRTHCNNCICNECGIGFVNKSLLQHHIRITHVNFKCEFCPEKFKTKFDRDKHEKLLHTQLRACKGNLSEKGSKCLLQKEQHTVKSHNTHSKVAAMDVEPLTLNRIIIVEDLHEVPSEESTETAAPNIVTADDVNSYLDTLRNAENTDNQDEDSDVSKMVIDDSKMDNDADDSKMDNDADDSKMDNDPDDSKMDNDADDCKMDNDADDSKMDNDADDSKIDNDTDDSKMDNDADDSKMDNDADDSKMVAIKNKTIDNSEYSLEISVKLEEIDEQDKHTYNIKTILECTNATIIRSCENESYNCFFCDKSYQIPSKLKEHATNTHTNIDINDLRNIDESFVTNLDVTELHCKICFRYIDTLQILGNHLNEVHSKNLFLDIKNQIVPLMFNKGVPTCCICFRICDSYRGLVLHLLVHYKQYSCEECDLSFIDMEKLHNNFPCNYCPRIFSDEQKIKIHKNEVHKEKILKFKCEKCNERFEFYKKKKAHILKAHNIRMKMKSAISPNDTDDAKNANDSINNSVDLASTIVAVPIKFDDARNKCVDYSTKKDNSAEKSSAASESKDPKFKRGSFVEVFITSDTKCSRTKLCIKSRSSYPDYTEDASKNRSKTTKAIRQYKDERVIVGFDMQTQNKSKDLPTCPEKIVIKVEEKYKIVYNIKTLLECTNASLIQSYDDIGYKCYFCSRNYKIPSKLKEHATNTHTFIDEENLNINVAGFMGILDMTDLYCKVCYRYIDTLQDFCDHLCEHGKKIFDDIKTPILPLIFHKGLAMCCVCLKTFKNYRTLVEHLLAHYSDYARINCDIGFINTQKLPERVPRVGNFPCRLCCRTFDNALNKADHEIKVHHYEFFKYKCDTCNERFQFVRQKALHLLDVHNIRESTNKFNNINTCSDSINTYMDKSVNSPDVEIKTQCEDVVELSDDEQQDMDNVDFNLELKARESQIKRDQRTVLINTSATEDVTKNVVEEDNIEIMSDCKDIVESLTTDVDDANQRTDKIAYNSQNHPFTFNYLSEEDKHFNNIKVILECSNATLIRSREDIGYSCLFCNKFHKTLPELKRHSLKSHTNIEKINFANIYVASYVAKLDITNLHCKLCYAKIEDMTNLFEHLTEKHKKEVYMELKNQILPLRLNGALIECCVCFHDFRKFQYLLYHMQKHYKSYTCIKCHEGFNKRSELISHSSNCKEDTAEDIKVT